MHYYYTGSENDKSQYVSQLQSYLGQLIRLDEQGKKVNREINATMDAIQRELGLSNLHVVDIDHHISHHTLVEWGLNDQPSVKGKPITVRELLNELAIGKTIHQLCGEYDLDINEASGAVTFAAYVVSNSVY